MNEKQNDDRRVVPTGKAPLFTAIVTVPFSTLAAIVTLAFGLATIVGGAAAVGGLGYAVASPFFAGRSGVTTVFLQIGLGLSASGVGLMVFSVFLLLTRYIAVRWTRILRYINGR